MPSARACLPGIVLFSLLAPAIFGASTETPEQKEKDKAAAVLLRQIAWDAATPGKKNPEGRRIEFVPIDDPASQQYRAEDRYLRYRLRVKGAPEELKYSLLIWNFDSSSSQFESVNEEVFVNAAGLMMTHPPSPEDEAKDAAGREDEIEIAVKTARGEPVRYALASHKKDLLIPGTLVPHPIAASGQRCRLEARLATLEGNTILLYADGLPANATIPFQVSFGAASQAVAFHTDAQGHAFAVENPLVKGAVAGVLKAVLATEGCSVSIEIPWGKGSYHIL